MNNQYTPLPLSAADRYRLEREDTQKMPSPPLPPSGRNEPPARSFWRERCIEGGLIVSMALYYLLCNKNLHFGILTQQNPLYSLPLLLLFAVLCWYRFPTALSLLPLTLPYYLSSYQKIVFGDKAFSLVEITLATCIFVALARFALLKEDRLLWRNLLAKIGPFLVPIVVFLLAATIASLLAVSRQVALRTLVEEVIGPLLYLALVTVYLSSRQDIQRLLAAFIGTGLIITLLGLAQYFIFKLPVDPEGSRVHAVYGSGNNIGTLFDYILPLLLALIMSRVSWKYRLTALLLSLPMFYILYLSQSRGAWIAIACAFCFVIAFSLRNQKIVLVGGVFLVAVLVIGLAFFHNSVFSFLEKGHVSSHGTSTLLKRPYLWLTAWHMIEDRPVLGYGMDNWLCYYSNNNLCRVDNVKHYWVTNDPITHKSTGLKDEPTLSHPHNIFLHVWVSTGLFGFLAFLSVIILFYWLFVRILARIYGPGNLKQESIRWMVVGVAAALTAAIIQGQVDSSFLEQDLSFCFWSLLAALLVLRLLTGTPWSGRTRK